MPTETPMMQSMFVRQSAGADALRIAEMAVAIWKDISIALSPIIGQPGVVALFKRSIHLTHSAHPFLAAVLEDKTEPDEFIAMQGVLAQQASATAVAANVALLLSFQDLLTSLIGLSLTERLLLPVWEKPSSGPAVQDTTS